MLCFPLLCGYARDGGSDTVAGAVQEWAINRTLLVDHLNITPENENNDNMSPLEDGKQTMVMCHLNVQSLLPKIEEVKTFLLSLKRPVILGISETWLNSSVQDGEIELSGFDLFRRDRGTRGGRILVFVSSCCRSWRRRDLEMDGVEAIWMEVHSKGKTMLVCNIYRPPNSSAAAMRDIACTIEKAAMERKELVVMGDLNCNMLTQNSDSDHLLLIAQENNLTQLISEPTRVAANSETLIDVLLSSEPNAFTNTGVLPLTGSDHLMIFGERVDIV